MSEMISIPKEELQCLRRHLSEATRLLQTLEVQESIAPELTPREKRIQKYSKKLSEVNNNN